MGFDAIYAVLPNHADKISRLQYLLTAARLPVVSVIGKYNHGKSSLLNALVGRVALQGAASQLERLQRLA